MHLQMKNNIELSMSSGHSGYDKGPEEKQDHAVFYLVLVKVTSSIGGVHTLSSVGTSHWTSSGHGTSLEPVPLGI